MIPKIEWPKHWDPDKGWPTQMHGLMQCGKTWGGASGWLLTHGSSLPTLVASLGRPQSDAWSFEEIRLAIREYHRIHNRWPTAVSPEAFSRDGRSWSGANHWLVKHGSSVADETFVCGRTRLNSWSVKYVRDCVLAYIRVHGGPPSASTTSRIPNDGRSWMAANSWLRLHTNERLTTIASDCVGRPRKGAWSITKLKKSVQLFHRQTGQWPHGHAGTIPQDGRAWISADTWLRKQGSSLAALNLACGRVPRGGWSVTDLTSQVRQFKRVHGKYPHGALGVMPDGRKTWAAADSWLRQETGQTLAQYCKGLP